ncbi:unnamed protein product [Linum tenue]|uniref:Fe2OG dioxygenase domain-containing protein n=1 Tax=Linum tenue TaxID=586396 RepID=A0AAV0JP98_9ROSI|nr:unnamed protein product [Linum tenue]
MADHDFPVIDLSPFSTTPGAGDAKKKEEVIRRIRGACSASGLFLIVNHGIPMAALSDTLAAACEYFDRPAEEKLKWVPPPADAASAIPTGYVNRAAVELARNNSEMFVIAPTGSASNVYPTEPPRFREKMERTFGNFQRTAKLIMTLLNDALGLPPDLLHQYNDNKQCDRMIGHHYFKATADTKKMIGSYPHKDANLFTLLLRDDVGGLEFLRNGQWIPVSPVPHSLVVNVGDFLQVLSNNEFNSVAHRVVSLSEKDRYSCAFGCQIDRDKWIEPLAELTSWIKMAPKFKGFYPGEFLHLVIASYKPSLDPNDTFALIDVVNHYALPPWTTPN